MYIALCSVKDTERERNTGFLSNFTAHASSILSHPSLPSSLSSSTVACVLWCSYRCLGLSGSSSGGGKQLTCLIYILHLCVCVSERVYERGCLLFDFISLTGPGATAVCCSKDIPRSFVRQGAPPLGY